MSARMVDANGYIYISANPITRAGVFQYLGSQIGAPEPDRIYNVYRPADELADPECMASFRGLPIIDDHVMLGRSEDGLTPAEQKGIHGVTGDAVAFENNVLYSDIRIYSEDLAKKIDSGKRGLSLGYRCAYEPETGTFAGQSYDYVQRSLRGNHLALVDEPRNDVYVLDNKLITFDSLDLKTTEEENTMATTIEALDKKIDEFISATTKRFAAQDEAEKKAQDEEAAKKADEEKKAADEAAAAEAEKKAAEDAEGDEEKKKDAAMDAAIKKIDALTKEVADLKSSATKAVFDEAAKRDALVKQLTPHIGAFDAADKTLADVQKYGCEKLGLKADAGQEGAALVGFFHNRPSAQVGVGIGMDAGAAKSDEITNYINGK